MSADIEILDDDKGQWVNLTIRAGGCIELDICVPQRGGPTGEATVRFDLHKKDHHPSMFRSRFNKFLIT